MVMVFCCSVFAECSTIELDACAVKKHEGLVMLWGDSMLWLEGWLRRRSSLIWVLTNASGLVFD